MIELYNGDCRAFLSNYNGERFDAVITDPPYASGGATLSERSASTSQKYTATKKACPFPDFMGDQMDARSWLHMMADVLALARVQCHDGAVLVVFVTGDRSRSSRMRCNGRAGNGAERWSGTN